MLQHSSGLPCNAFAGSQLPRHLHHQSQTLQDSTFLGHAGALEDIPWREVKVGQVLRVNDDELFPADLLCLASALPDNVCFIKTTNLDGESNLKIRRPIDTTAVPDDSGEAQVLHTRATLQCEGPNADLHNFNGRFDPDVTAGKLTTSMRICRPCIPCPLPNVPWRCCESVSRRPVELLPLPCHASKRQHACSARLSQLYVDLSALQNSAVSQPGPPPAMQHHTSSFCEQKEQTCQNACIIWMPVLTCGGQWLRLDMDVGRRQGSQSHPCNN